jgi:ABC-type branched-subunit amino acid transport system substrate-binding protein
MQLGATLYFNAVNANGGVNGRKIVLKTLDDGYEATRAADNTKKLITEDRVFALFGYVGTPTSAASMPIFTEARVPS